MFCNIIYSLLNLFKMTSMISDDIQKRLAENVKRIRKSKKLTQFQLAERADVSVLRWNQNHSKNLIH